MQSHPHPLLLPSAIFLICTLSLSTASAATCHPNDEAGLLGFKSGIKSDPSSMLTSWKKGTGCCNWVGVHCQNQTGSRVSYISLSGQPGNLTTTLSGTVSSSLSKLQHLEAIYLYDLKYISGPLPNSLFNLPLQYIFIENNNLSGRIPAGIANLTRLHALSLQGNQFTGPIPSSIADLTQLTQLRLSSNRLSGTIPASFQRLRNLTLLQINQNHLSGPIPDIFSGLSDLTELELSHNKFTGNIPASISSLAPRLAYLDLGYNSLTGKIPNFLGKFQALYTLNLSSNRFSGTVPKSFANLTKIFNLDLSRNLLVDPFPELGVEEIHSLDLSYNNFHLGSIPQWVTTSPIIFSLKLAKCGIKIKIDDWKPTEPHYYDSFDLSENEITGNPVKLLNQIEYLAEFVASGNKLKFNLESLKFAKSLKSLDLSRNLVFGKVPKAISGLSQLNVSLNHLCGALPANKFPASAFAGNDCLCGSPLPPCKA